jgi:hypothetical protein
MKDLKNSLKKMKSTLSLKEINQQVIPISDFTKNFTSIIDHFNKDERTRFLALETALMIANFFIVNNMKKDAFNLIIYSVYIPCNTISEISKVNIFSSFPSP